MSDDPRLWAVMVEIADYLPEHFPTESADGGRTIRGCAERVLAAADAEDPVRRAVRDVFAVVREQRPLPNAWAP